MIALLVIDIQRGAFDGERCTPIDRAQSLIANAGLLIDAARAASRPVVFIQHCAAAGAVLEEGSVRGELHESMKPLPGEPVIKKYDSSAFEGTDLAQTLEALAVQELVVCGLQSEHCVFNTASAALQRGFSVVVAQDAHSTWPTPLETSSAISERVNVTLHASGAKLISTAGLIRALR